MKQTVKTVLALLGAAAALVLLLYTAPGACYL